MKGASGDNRSNVDADAKRIAVVEVQFGRHLWNREYADAAKTLSSALDDIFKISRNVGAWFALWLGYCHELLGDLQTAQTFYRRARSAAKSIPAYPDDQPEASAGQEHSAQVVEVARYLHRGEGINRDVLRDFDIGLAPLDGGASPAQTSEAIRLLGEFLGLNSSRPDDEHGTGPDVLWYIPQGTAWSLELKTDKVTPTAYFKKEVMQVGDHVQWVKDNVDVTEIMPAFVGPLLPADDKANPTPETVVIALGAFRELRDRLRAALEDIVTRALPISLRPTVDEVFRQRGLLWADIHRTMPRTRLTDIGA